MSNFHCNESFWVFKHWCSLISKRKKVIFFYLFFTHGFRTGSTFTQLYYVCWELFVLEWTLGMANERFRSQRAENGKNTSHLACLITHSKSGFVFILIWLVNCMFIIIVALFYKIMQHLCINTFYFLWFN